jgi:hypothetical protein
LSSTRPANHHRALAAGEGAGQLSNRIFERHRFGAHLFQAAPAAPVDGLLEQMRRNGHWVLAKGIDFEAAFRFKLHPHDFGLTVGPTVFEPTRQPPERPTATI